MKRELFAIALLAAASAPVLAQSPPSQLHFQARLTDAAGVALNGAVAVEVRLYDAPAGGVPLWNESHAATALNGVVTLSLGSITPLPAGIFDSTARFLAVRVGADAEMTPRRQVLSVPYAARAGTVAALTAGTTIPNNLITTAHVLDGSLVGNDFANNSIGAGKLAVGAVLSANIADGQVFGNDIADGSISASKLGINSVTSVAIANGTIFGVKIANETIDGSKILDGSIGAADLANGAVGAGQIAPDSIDHTKILNGTITTFDIGDGAVTFNDLDDSSVGFQKLSDGGVTSSKIANGSITNLKVSNAAAIQGTKIDPDFGSQDVVTLGDVGAGTASPSARLHVLGTAFPTLLSERTSNFTTANATALQCLARTSANMADGFGPSISFSAADVAGVVNDFAQISAERRGADDSGRLVIRMFNGGTGADAMLVDADGKVAVGTSSPSSQHVLTVAGGFDTGILGTSASGGQHGIEGLTAGGGAGVRGENTAPSNSSHGVRGTNLSASGFGVFSNGNFGVSGTKAFVQPHPSDPAREIHFLCLEGNESGTYFRGSATLNGGRAVIDVPEEFRLVSEPDGLTVQLTPSGARTVLWTESEGLDRIVVRGDLDVKFHYVVNGVRRGYAGHQAVRVNRHYIPSTRGVPFGTQYPDALRRVLVENGILNPDFTPNEETAAKLGWTLHDPEPADLSKGPRASREGAAR